MDKSTRPERIMRYFVAGRQVSPEEFWEAVRELGGRALVDALPPEPLEPGYRLTPAGQAALRREGAGR